MGHDTRQFSRQFKIIWEGRLLMAQRTPIPIAEVLAYLQLEDAEDLVPGSVKYVGEAKIGQRTVHFWSFPTSDDVQWVAMDDHMLGAAVETPDSIRAQTLAREAHRLKSAPRPPKTPWVASNMPKGAEPKWIPSSHIQSADVSYVAAFEYEFDLALARFKARPTVDKYGGGAGLHRYFFLELHANRLAQICWCESRPKSLELHLRAATTGRVDWEDYDQIMDRLGVPLEKVFRQGGLVWRYRKPTPELLQQKQDHYQRMWIPGPVLRSKLS